MQDHGCLGLSFPRPPDYKKSPSSPDSATLRWVFSDRRSLSAACPDKLTDFFRDNNEIHWRRRFLFSNNGSGEFRMVGMRD